MPRPRPPYLLKETDRKGVVWYVRRGKGPRIRIRGEYGSKEFMAAYQAALKGHDVPSQAGECPAAGSLTWLVAQYQQSAAWLALDLSTQRNRGNLLKTVVAKAGDWPAAKLSQAMVARGIDDRAKTPGQAQNFLKTMRGFCKWAAVAQHIPSDPTLGVRAPARNGDGYHTWTEEEIIAFERRWAEGTRERLALAVLLYTGLRRGDAATLGRRHIKNGVIQMRTEKTGTPIYIPVLPALQRSIDASPTGDLALIATLDGRPFSKNSFSNWFAAACRAAGVKGSAHGLRKAGAVRAAEAGATERELMAIFGWTDPKMAAHYTRAADSKRLAEGAAHKLARNETETSIPGQRASVRGSGKKDE